MTDRELVTATEGAERLGVPAGTIRSWRSQHRVTPVMIDVDGRILYDLAELRDLAAATRRRGRHAARDRSA